MSSSSPKVGRISTSNPGSPSTHSRRGSDRDREWARLKLQQVWDCNPTQYRQAITDCLAKAQGELALEQYIQDIREAWENLDILVIRRQDALMLTGWADLFAALDDHLTSLTSLQQSPYFHNVAEFVVETNKWEEDLLVLKALLGALAEVQRRWQYLRGIFQNPDLVLQLPTLHRKFKGADAEIIALINLIHAKPAALHLLKVDNLERRLDRYEGIFGTVQKGLGDYLEKQRAAFPRFYFIDNEQLVEIIGNSFDAMKAVQYLGKMFSSVTSLRFEVDQNCNAEDNQGGGMRSAVAVYSKEGETLLLKIPESVEVPVQKWLNRLEENIVETLRSGVEGTLAQVSRIFSSDESFINADALLEWMTSTCSQLLLLGLQLSWTLACEAALCDVRVKIKLGALLESVQSRLHALSECVATDLEPLVRIKAEQVLTESVHQRDVVRDIQDQDVDSPSHFAWVSCLRYYHCDPGSPSTSDSSSSIQVKMANASFDYSFEYLGIREILVQTPLTDRCYLCLTQALKFRMGGNPFGPAGTGKTESVKMLGCNLGRFVLVFNCDASFDYAAMGRIFAGLCRVGAWGCFDEFNRLEERILSAVSQEVLTIQKGLLLNKKSIELLGESCPLHPRMGIFITLNPGYKGRSNLPDTLKKLFVVWQWWLQTRSSLYR